jgi:hypothetical protein
MTLWETHGLEEKVRHVLAHVDTHNAEHHLGRPFMTAYQLAIGLARMYPDTFAKLGMPLGGAGTGERNSLAQYVAGVLSRKIQSDLGYFVEGALLSNQDVETIDYRNASNETVTSSLTGTGFGLSMFRLRML